MATHVQNLAWNFGLFDWMSSAAPARIAASNADSTRRPIGVTAFIEDPRARTMHAWISLPSKVEYHVGVDGEAVDIWIQGNADRQLNSVVLGTFALSAHEGCQRSLALLFSLLSSWSFQTQRPVGLRELQIEDKTHGAKWVVRPQAQAPLKLNDITVSLGAPNPIGSLLALFREGMASEQPAYRFLCYYKIIEAWNKGSGPFEQVRELLPDKGKIASRKALKIEAAMFEGKWDQEKYKHLLGKKFGWCFEQMNDARKFLAHPFDSDGVFVSLDDPSTLQAISDAANIAERMVIEILVEEIRIVESLGVSENSRRVIAGYVHASWGRDLLERSSTTRSTLE
jgi:Methylamine utilization protein MauJ